MATGVWLIGASGNVATTVAVGLAALRRELCGSTGLVTELPGIADLDLVPLGKLVLGGCDVRPPDLLARAERLAEVDRALSPRLVDAVKPELEALAGEVATGITAAGPRAIDEVQAALRRFGERHGLDRIAVVNLASTEPPFDGALPADPDQLWRAIAAGA